VRTAASESFLFTCNFLAAVQSRTFYVAFQLFRLLSQPHPPPPPFQCRSPAFLYWACRWRRSFGDRGKFSFVRSQ
jgi:hypothetical protein